MDCKFVKNIDLLAFAFNQEKSSIFYLVEMPSTLKILEENLYTRTIVNHFKVPLKHKKLEADNYLMAYNKKLKILVLTLAYHILVFSLVEGCLVFAGQCHGKNPYIITSIAMLENASIMFFAASEQRNIYCVNLEDCISTGTMPNFTKLKLPQDVSVTDMKVHEGKLVAACNDKVIRCWNVNSLTSLKGIRIQPSAGDITSISFSRDGSKFLAATSKGQLLSWNGKTLGNQNQLVLSQKISDKKIICITWFHYCGQVQSKRFIVITSDGKVHLFSFTLQKTELDRKQVYLGKVYGLNIISEINSETNQYTVVAVHPYSNHICFNPGRILYMVDYTPALYYPILSNQLTRSFYQLVPNSKNELFWQRELFFVEGMEIKRLKEGVQKKLSLNSVLEHEGLKILKLESRPLSLKSSKTYKFLIEYYLGSVKRVLMIYNYQIDSTSDHIDHYKEIPCSMGLFLGSPSLTDPPVFLLNEDRQSICVMLNYEKSRRAEIIQDLNTQEKSIYESPPGEIVTLGLNVKIQKVFPTPFRHGFCVLYKTQDLIRFSRNSLKENSILDFDILQQPQLRVNYTDIIIDVVWNACENPIGAVVCLDKVSFVNSSLEQIITVSTEGYITQAFWQGYTLFVTTKIEFIYITLNGSTVRLYNLDTQEDKYSVCMLMADRIISAAKNNSKKKEKQSLDFKIRYFNLMEPLLAGYVAYCNTIGSKADGGLIKRVVQTYLPHNRVSVQFLRLLNSNQLTTFSNYFLDLYPQLYERQLKAQVLCYQMGLNKITRVLFDQEFEVEEFWRKPIFYRHQKDVLSNLYMAIVCTIDKQSRQRPQDFINKIKSQVTINTEKLKQLVTKGVSALNSRTPLALTSTFGTKNLTQKYKDDIGGKLVDMVIQEVEISSVAQWIGLFSNFVQAKMSSYEEKAKDDFEEPEGEFNDLLVYYRFDQGKGDIVRDLSDYGNNAKILNYQTDKMWVPLENQEPLQVQDKWGKKCPPQFSIRVCKRFIVQKSTAPKVKPFFDFTLELWIKPQSDGSFVSFGEVLIVRLSESRLRIKANGVQLDLKPKSTESPDPLVSLNVWTHISVIYEQQSKVLQCVLNSLSAFQAVNTPDICLSMAEPLHLGSTQFEGQITEFRLWKESLSIDQIRDSLRSPLSIVAEKWKKFNMKIREKKSSSKQTPINMLQFTLDPPQQNAEVGAKNPGINVDDWGLPF